MAQPTITVTDTTTGQRKQAWVYAAGELLAAQGAAESIITARGAKQFVSAPEGRFAVAGVEGNDLGRYDLVDATPAMAAPAAVIGWQAPATPKQIAYLRILIGKAPVELEAAAQRYAASLTSLTKGEATYAIDLLTWKI